MTTMLSLTPALSSLVVPVITSANKTLFKECNDEEVAIDTKKSQHAPTSVNVIESFDTPSVLPFNVEQYKKEIVAQRDAQWTLNVLAFETDWRKRFYLERHSDETLSCKCTIVLHFFMKSSEIEFRLRSDTVSTVVDEKTGKALRHFEHFGVHPLVAPDPYLVCLDCKTPPAGALFQHINTHRHRASHKHLHSAHPIEQTWLTTTHAATPNKPIQLESLFDLSTCNVTSMACPVLDEGTWVRVSMIGDERVTRNMMMLALEQVLRLPLHTLYPIDDELVVHDNNTRLGDCLMDRCEVRKFIDYTSFDAHIFGDAQRPALYDNSCCDSADGVVVSPRNNDVQAISPPSTPPRTITPYPPNAPPSIKNRRAQLHRARRGACYM